MVTLTAVFSEAMRATPTLTISGVLTDSLMTATTSASVWTYFWTVSTTLNGEVSAVVSGSDLLGNPYSGSDELTFTLDNLGPSVTLTSSDEDKIISINDNITITANFNEDMRNTPTISITGAVSDSLMTATTSATWTYLWTVSSTTDTTFSATVSGSDLFGNPYIGDENITFTKDQSGPEILSVVTDPAMEYLDVSFSEGVYSFDKSLSGVLSTSFVIYKGNDENSGITITDVSLAGATNGITGGELLLRLSIDIPAGTPLGEVYYVTAVASAVFDIDLNPDVYNSKQQHNCSRRRYR